MKKMQTKASLSPRLRKPVRDFYSSNFDTPTAGAEFALEAFRSIIRKMLAGLEGKFTRDELGMLIDVFRDLILAFDPFGEHIIDDVMDAIRFEWLDNGKRRSGIDFVKKLETLSALQLGALAVWARAYWIQKARSDAGVSITLDNYVTALMPLEANK
jgi:hypothetical protein